MAETDKSPPVWMLQLENRLKKQHRLAHEVGAGARCLKCVEACPGLDLHFWRKVCRNCRCRKEDHDITDDDLYIQFDILLCPGDSSPKKIREKAVLDLNVPVDQAEGTDSSCTGTAGTEVVEKKSCTMDWVPPYVSLDLAAEYMEKLPPSKLPITGTSGALYRKQQYERQLPAHDIESSLCHALTADEVKSFNRYLKQLRSNVVGQGRVEKVTMLTPYQVAEVANQIVQEPYWSANLNNPKWIPKRYTNPAGNLEMNSSYTDESTEDSSGWPKFNFKSPSDFIASSNRLGNTPVDNFNFNNYNNNNINGVESAGHNMNFESGSSSLPCNAITDTISAEKHLAQSSLVPGQKITGLNQISKNVSQHAQSDLNDVYPAEFDDNPSSQQSGLNMAQQLALDALQISDSKQIVYVEHSDSVNLQKPIFSDRLKHVSSDNIHDYSQKQIPTDTNVQLTGKCDGNNLETSSDNYKDCVKLPCNLCNEVIFHGEVIVSVTKDEKRYFWHPQCFVCMECKELLVDLVYFFHKGNVYCGRHYAVIMNIPRCFACDELIFVNQYTIAENENYHIRHFCCIHCDVPLGGKQYIPVDNHPVCMDCFNIRFPRFCSTCQQIIAAVDKRVSVKDLHWHATDVCFCCFGCKKSLLQSKMILYDNKPFCNKACVTKSY